MCKSSFRLSLLVILLVLLIAVPGWGNAIGSFDQNSLSITTISGPVISGTNYTFDFTLNGITTGTSSGEYVSSTSQFGYLSLSTGAGLALISNEPIPLVSAITSEANHFWFAPPSGFSGPMYAIVSDTPVISAIPDADWTSFTQTGSVNNYGADDLQGQQGTTAGNNPLPPTPPGAPIIEGYLRGGVADLKQFKNECGPTSTTNSILWLIKKYKLPTDKLPKKPDGTLDEQAILHQLAEAMVKQNPSGHDVWNETNPPVNNDRGYQGLWDDALKKGKTQWFKDKGIMMETHGGENDPDANGAKAFNFIKSEMKDGEDVEMLIQWDSDGFHWVTVTGWIDAGVDNKTVIVHDPLRGNGNNYWKLKDDGTFVGVDDAKIAWAVSESVPEPASLTLLATGLAVGAAALRKRILR